MFMNDLFELNENIYNLSEELKTQERKIIDLSSNINPLGVSKKIKAELRKHLKYLHNYPDNEARRLKRFISKYHNVKSDMIVIGNGLISLLNIIINYINPSTLIIPAPTVPIYEKLFLFNKHITKTNKIEDKTIGYFFLNEKDDFSFDVERFINYLSDFKDKIYTNKNNNIPFIVVLSNPNNPTGRLIKKEDVLKIARILYLMKGYLIVDEAYMDFCSDESVVGYIDENPNLIVLKSFSCYYALTGLRLGYGISSSETINNLNNLIIPWSVNNLAQRAGVVALKDKAYRKESSALIKEEKEFYEHSFQKADIKYYKSDANFYLIKHEKARDIFEHLKKKGILVRHCSDIKGLGENYLRVSIKKHRENSIFFKELFVYLKSN